MSNDDAHRREIERRNREALERIRRENERKQREHLESIRRNYPKR